MNTIRRQCPPCGCACQCCECRPPWAAMVATGDAASIAQTSATIMGNTFSGIIGTIDFVAVQYAPRLEAAVPMMACGAVGSPFSVALTDLLPGTAYDYRAVVCTAGGGCCFGAFKSFVTLPTPPAPTPTVSTGDAVNITEATATIIGNAFSGIAAPVDFVAVQYDTDPGMAAPMTAYGTPESPFSVGLTGLEPGTAYFYRAVVGTSDGVHSGDVKTFVTLQPVPAPVVVTGNATQILGNSAIILDNTFSGVVGTIHFIGVQYDTSPTMANVTLVQVAIESPFNVGLVGLQPGATYYYRAAVGLATGSHYGAIKSFVTPG